MLRRMHARRTVAILAVASLIAGVLQWEPAMLIEVPLTISSATRGQVGLAPAQAAIAYLLDRSPNMLPIPGTSDPAHLEDNTTATVQPMRSRKRRMTADDSNDEGNTRD